MPRHFPQRHADIDEAVDPEFRAYARWLHSDDHAPRVSIRCQPPQFALSERDCLAQQVSLDRFERQRLRTVWRDGHFCADKRYAKNDRASLLRCEARVIADINKLVEDPSFGQVDAGETIQRRRGPSALEFRVQVPRIDASRHQPAP
jgi:hypothetical protein